jgi:Holliday junction resolvasome RuvABC endonuclease subunit
MGLARTLKVMRSKPATVMGIDASSTVIAFAIIRSDADSTKLLKVAKVNLSNFSMNAKFKIVSTIIPEVFKDNHIDYTFVEQPIYIQNPATSRILSQVSGHLIGECLKQCNNVSEVTIANWKSHIGYKNVSKAEKESWTKQFGEKESKKMAASERKQRTIRIIHNKIPNIKHITDNDICDSIGIALYGLDKINKEDSDVS